MKKELRCKSCGAIIEGEGPYHAGFGDLGFLYCNHDTTILTFSSFDPMYVRLAGKMNPIKPKEKGYVHPWTLIDEHESESLSNIEHMLISCPCGGKFLFQNPLRCPICHGVFSEPLSSKNVYFYVLDRWIDGEKENIWKNHSEKV